MPDRMIDGVDIARLKASFTGHAGELGQRYIAHGDDWAEVLGNGPALANAERDGTPSRSQMCWPACVTASMPTPVA